MIRSVALVTILASLPVSQSFTAASPPQTQLLSVRSHGMPISKRVFRPTTIGSRQDIRISSSLYALQKDKGNAVLTTLEEIADSLDNASGGWATTYADLSPETSATPLGISFLATNLAYSWAGYQLLQQSSGSNAALGILTEAASVASFAYHYCQLESNGPKDLTVRLVLVVDYLIAWTAICLALTYFITTPQMSVPIEGIAATVLSLACLGLSWIWEASTPYLIFHGLWHVLGAYGGYAVGQAHLEALQRVAVS